MIEIQSLRGNDLTNDQLIPGIRMMQEELKLIPEENLIANSGAIYKNDKLVINAFFQELEIDQQTFTIRDSNKDPESTTVQSILLSYLKISDGAPSSGRLISFRELPDGSNYCHAFEGYASGRLARHFQQNPGEFSKACLKTGGIPVDTGDAGFTFHVLPRIGITAVYYLGDETFPSSVSLLFDSNVSHYMITAGLASIGAALVEIIINNNCGIDT